MRKGTHVGSLQCGTQVSGTSLSMSKEERWNENKGQ